MENLSDKEGFIEEEVDFILDTINEYLTKKASISVPFRAVPKEQF